VTCVERSRMSTDVDARSCAVTDVDVRPLAAVIVCWRAQCEWAFRVNSSHGQLVTKKSCYELTVWFDGVATSWPASSQLVAGSTRHTKTSCDGVRVFLECRKLSRGNLQKIKCGTFRILQPKNSAFLRIAKLPFARIVQQMCNWCIAASLHQASCGPLLPYSLWSVCQRTG